MTQPVPHEVVRRSYIRGRIEEPGAIVNWDPDTAGANLKRKDGARAAREEGSGEGGGDSAKALKAEIAESTDKERLEALMADERKSVAEAAMRRLSELEGGD